jgi:predicted acyl esterase
MVGASYLGYVQMALAADPTPSVGGQLLSPQAGPQDNSAIEARADVLVFTGEPLRAPLDVLGPVRAEQHVRASSGHAHVFVRLCDVDTEGRSRNVTDGIVRLGPGVTGRQAVSVPMSSTARHLDRADRQGERVVAGQCAATLVGGVAGPRRGCRRCGLGAPSRPEAEASQVARHAARSASALADHPYSGQYFPRTI